VLELFGNLFDEDSVEDRMNIIVITVTLKIVQDAGKNAAIFPCAGGEVKTYENSVKHTSWNWK
jgi:hypothetical protein